MGTFTGTGGAQLHYDELGSSTLAPVILLAGGPARHPKYLGDLAGLSEQHRLVVPHLRGVGRSPAPEDGALGSFWRQAEDIERLSAALGCQKSVVIGHSAGTRLAVSYAVRFPDQVSALILITPPTSYLVREPSDAEQVAQGRWGDVAFEDAWARLNAGADTDSDRAFNEWQIATAPVGYANWGRREQSHAHNGAWKLDAARAFLAARLPDDFAESVAAIGTPTLVVAGAQDALIGLAPVRALADLFTDGRLTVIDECGHYPWIEHPEAFRAAVDPFLLRHVPRSLDIVCR